MQNPRAFSDPLELELDDNPPFNVVIAYDDLPTGKQAKETYDRLRHELGASQDPNLKLWKFDLLEMPRMKEIAANDAAQADMIIISARDDRDLPMTVKHWVEMWLARKIAGDNPTALAVLINRDQSRHHADSTMTRYFEQIADRAQMDFFFHSVNLPEASSARAGEWEAPAAHSPVPRWGINE